MRVYLLFPAVALVAACGSPETADKNASGTNGLIAAAASRGAPPPAPLPSQAAPAPARETAIPAPFLGVYDGSIEACARSSDQRLTVAPRELRFHESLGAVRSVAARRPGAVEVEADYQGEGESWRSVRELRLSDGGARLTVSGDGTRLDRVRCPAGAR